MFRLENEEFTKQVMEECGLQTPGKETKGLAPAIDITKIPSRLCTRCGHNMKVIPRALYTNNQDPLEVMFRLAANLAATLLKDVSLIFQRPSNG